MRILFTKTLLESQKAQIESFGVFNSVVDIPFINVLLISYQQFVDNYGELVNKPIPVVISSMRAAEWLIQHYPGNIEHLWAISEKTAQPVQSKVQELHIASEASSLILAKEILSQNYEEINFFCGNLHRPEIPQLLAEQGIRVNAFEVYTTELKSIRIKETFDIICFFSPSAVQSFFELNSWSQDSIGLCIGSTTAEALKAKGVKKIIYPDLSGFENMLERLKRHLELENGISRVEK